MVQDNKVGIIDIGSARTKVLLMQYGEDGELISHLKKFDTFLGEQFSNNNLIEERALLDLIQLLRSKVEELRSEGVSKLLVLGTSAIRESKNNDKVTQDIFGVTGTFNVLSQEDEGKIFLEGLKTAYPQMNDFCAIDIGGGSVQLMISDNVFSFPTGTFKLEAKFQKNGSDIETQLHAMESYVNNEMSTQLHDKFTADTLIVGSNQMKDFFESALKLCLSTELLEEGIMLDEVISLYECLRLQPYESLSYAYPSNPGFMYGADKALINCIAACKALNVKRIVPTNESLSSALGRLMLNGADIEKFGLVANNL